MDLKTVIITGGTSGIGKSLASYYALEGFNVVISGRDESRLLSAVEELKAGNSNVIGIRADVSDMTQCEKLIDETIRHFGNIHILINNAGVSMRGLFADTRIEVIKQLMDSNFWGTVYCTKFALPHLLKTKGSVVGISSIAGKKGLPGRTGYSASKFAMEGFLETLRIENLKTGLHVLVACPGFTATAIRSSSLGPDGSPQKESPRDENSMMSADLVAKKIASAIKTRKRDLVMTSAGKLTVFLNKWFPSLTDKLVYRHMASEPGSPFKN